MTDDEQKAFLALPPNLQEMFQRYHMEYHLQPSLYGDHHHNMVGFHIDEAVYGPLYYGYGDTEPYTRSWMARNIEAHIMEVAPDTVLVLVKASPEVIAKRLKEDPHQNGLVQEKDIERVLQRFEEEYASSFLRRKVTVDNGTGPVEETLEQFVEQIEQHLTEADRLRILTHQAMHKAG